MENQRKERTIDELTAEIEALRAENERFECGGLSCQAIPSP